LSIISISSHSFCPSSLSCSWIYSIPPSAALVIGTSLYSHLGIVCGLVVGVRTDEVNPSGDNLHDSPLHILLVLVGVATKRSLHKDLTTLREVLRTGLTLSTPDYDLEPGGTLLLLALLVSPRLIGGYREVADRLARASVSDLWIMTEISQNLDSIERHVFLLFLLSVVSLLVEVLKRNQRIWKISDNFPLLSVQLNWATSCINTGVSNHDALRIKEENLLSVSRSHVGKLPSLLVQDCLTTSIFDCLLTV